MDELNGLLDRIEEAAAARQDGARERLVHAAGRMYAHHAMDVGVCKLRNRPTDVARDGIARSKAVFDKIARLGDGLQARKF